MPDLATPARFAMPIRELHAATAGDGETPAGTFEAVVSTFDHIVPGVLYDRVIKPGAFTRSLRDRGLPSLVWSHNWDTPPIGRTLEARETDEGLVVRAQLYVDGDHPDPLALRVMRAMGDTNGDGRAPLREFSIGFDIVDAEWEVRDGNDVLAVTDAELYEFGPCLVGANRTRAIEVAMSRTAEGGRDPLLDRFPRPARRDSTGSRAVRDLMTARPR